MCLKVPKKCSAGQAGPGRSAEVLTEAAGSTLRSMGNGLK